MSLEALAVSDDRTITDTIDTIFKFIGQGLCPARDMDSLRQAVESRREFVIALVALEETAARQNVLGYLHRTAPSLPVYLLRGEAELGQALPPGATGEMAFPLEYRRLLGCIRQAEQEKKAGGRARGLSATLTGCSAALREVQALIRHVAMTDANVLLLGESGTGKEVVARGIHQLSLRTDKPFVAVNCGAIPAELLESELFGHEKGAFSGAINMRRGRFELAEGGTLFLDEIGDMPLPMQVKLLRVIQERTFERVGGNKTLSSDVRLIAATHQDLERHIEEGKFRLDLYYRLNVFPIELPALRNRVDDIPLLIREFATRMEVEHSSPVEFDDSAILCLSNHPLPGNVRELENLVERLAILYPGETITEDKLPKRYQVDHARVPACEELMELAPGPQTRDREEALALRGERQGADPLDLKEYLSTLEKTLIEQALEKSNWVVAKAAKNLSLQRTTLVEKIKKYDLQNS